MSNMSNPIESINKTIKPYLGLKKINRKDTESAIIQLENGITYRFCDGSFYSEFNYESIGYTQLTNNQHYQLDLQNPNTFYSEDRLKTIDAYFDRKYDFSMTFRTSIFYKSLEEICKNIQKIIQVELVYNFQQNRIEIHEDLDFKFYPYYLVPIWDNYNFDPKTQDQYVFCFNPRYLLLGLSHSLEFTTICSNENSPMIIYGSNTVNFQDKSYRALVMNMYRKPD